MLFYCYEIPPSPNHTQAFDDRPAENDWPAILSRGDRPDKVIQALVKELPSPRWSKEYQMVYIENKKENLGAIFRKFRGVAWVNCQYFFPNRPVNNGHQELDINHFRKRELPESYRKCPEAYLQKLEFRKYAYNTARTYISLFEAYMNYYANRELIELNEEDVRKYLQHLVQLNKSDSYLNQAVNAIKFYYEVVMGMPNRFYSIERPRHGGPGRRKSCRRCLVSRK